MTNSSKIAIGLAAAALAGVGIGLLIAPESGDNTRENIRKGVNDLANNALDTLKDSQETIGEKVEGAVDTAKAKYNEALGYMKAETKGTESLSEMAEDAVDTVKNKYHQAKGYAKAELNNAS